VLKCIWDDDEKKWHLTVEKTATGETYTETADIVIACRGNLNDPSWPAITGLDTFKGEKMHSAAWNDR
jgi:cation diffusion facilitator CzcD-associated flavoprotein CzcO